MNGDILSFEDRAQLGKILTRLHNESGESVRYVAKETGLSAGSIASWMKGRSWPSTGSLIKILGFYGYRPGVGRRVS